MTTSDTNQIQGSSPDFKTELARQLQELVPEAIADGKVDVAKLRELLADDAGDENERFGLFWPGKRHAMRAAQEPTTATLKPMKDQSKDWDTTKNVFIEGDNLEVLKVLQKHYHNKIKMIYIDPPYNTGGDFIYPDNYKEGLAAYLEFTSQLDGEGKKLRSNAETDGRYHSTWLNMMYPRLKLARNLLTDDGVMFVSIDDAEQDNLRKLCNEVFGEANFIAQVVWQRKRGKDNSAKFLSRNHEYVFVVARNIERAAFARLPLGEETRKAYRNPDNDPRGPYRLLGAWARGTQGGSRFEFTSKSGKVFSERLWLMNHASLSGLDRDDKLTFVGDKVYRKLFLSENSGSIPETIWNDTSNAANAADEIKALFGSQVFDTVKPTPLIRRMMQLATTGDDIVLDFFSGSGSTGDAVMRQNAEDGGRRRYVLVQLPEPTPEDSIARRAGFETISELARKRLALAASRTRADFGTTDEATVSDRDLGFRAYKLGETSFSKWIARSDEDAGALQQQLIQIRDSASNTASQDDLLAELLLKQGYSLTERIERAEVAGLDTWRVADGDVVAYLDERTKPSLEQLRALAESGARKLIVIEDAFQGDDELKTNLVQLCKTHGVELWTA